MRSNLRNEVNLGFDTDLQPHRLLWGHTLASLAFCSGIITGVSTAEASMVTIQDAASALFEARMDERLADSGLFDQLKNMDVKLFVAQLMDHAVSNVEGVYDAFAQYVPNGGDGFAASLTDNPAAQLANDLIMETDEKMDWLSPLLKTAALGGTIFAAAYALSRASTAFKAWFVTTSEEYFEKRKELLVSGRAVKSDILETRERAITAYARLVAFDLGGPQATLTPAHLDFAQAALVDLPLGEVLQELNEKMRELTLGRREALRDVVLQGGDRTTVGSVRMRDIVREVIMDRSPDVVDPFAPAPGDPGPT